MTNKLTHPTVHLVEGGEYVLIPRIEYLRLVRANGIGDHVGEGPIGETGSLDDDRSAIIKEMGRRVHWGRKRAGLTRAALARRLGVSVAAVRRVEHARFSGHYIDRMLKACRLPAEWVREKVSLAIAGN